MHFSLAKGDVTKQIKSSQKFANIKGAEANTICNSVRKLSTSRGMQTAHSPFPNTASKKDGTPTPVELPRGISDAVRESEDWRRWFMMALTIEREKGLCNALIPLLNSVFRLRGI